MHPYQNDSIFSTIKLSFLLNLNSIQLQTFTIKKGNRAIHSHRMIKLSHAPVII